MRLIAHILPSKTFDPLLLRADQHISPIPGRRPLSGMIPKICCVLNVVAFRVHQESRGAGVDRWVFYEADSVSAHHISSARYAALLRQQSLVQLHQAYVYSVSDCEDSKFSVPTFVPAPSDSRFREGNSTHYIAQLFMMYGRCHTR